MLRTAFWAFVVISTGSILESRPIGYGFFSDMYAYNEQKSRELVSFSGLFFTIEKKTVVCNYKNKDTMVCSITVLNPQPRVIGEIEFTKVKGNAQAVNLLRLNRKRAWQRQFPALNHYVEEHIRVGEFWSIVQKAQYFLLNNSFLPVLLRAFDVVVTKDVLVSVVISSHSADWPLLEKEIDSLVQSLSKTAKKR